MKRWLAIIIAICFIFVASAWGVANAEVSEVSTEKDYIADDLAATKATLDAKEAELFATKASLEEIEEELEVAQADKLYWEDKAEYWEIEANPGQFNSLLELKNWLAEDDTDSNEYIEGVFDCDDFAMTLQKNAKEDGYKIDIQVFYADEIFYDFDDDLCLYFEYSYYWPENIFLDFDSYHAMNTTIIGNRVYLIEPSNDEVILLCYID